MKPSGIFSSPVGNPVFIEHFLRIYDKVLECHAKDSVTDEEIESFRSYLQKEMRPFNYRDYGNPAYDGIHYRVSDDEDEVPRAAHG